MTSKTQILLSPYLDTYITDIRKVVVLFFLYIQQRCNDTREDTAHLSKVVYAKNNNKHSVCHDGHNALISSHVVWALPSQPIIMAFQGDMTLQVKPNSHPASCFMG